MSVHSMKPNRPGGMKLVKVYVYCVWFEVGNLRGAIESAMEHPISRMDHVMGLQQQIQSTVQARDDKGNIVIGGQPPPVLITNWKLLRDEMIEEHVLRDRVKAVAGEQAAAEAEAHA